MNITSNPTNIITPTVVNPPTDSLRRENSQRELIAKPVAAQQAAAEKGVASEKERGRSPAQNSQDVDFESLQKQAELANQTINGDEQNPSSESEQQQSAPKKETSEGDSTTSHDDHNHEHNESAISAEEQQIINELKQRDLEVRAHEQAHAAAGGATTGAPSYSFEVGPDGKKYAVEGEVSVDLSVVEGNPRATIAKMQKVHSAALAPANPSIQDTRVANTAAQIIAQAQSELLAMEFEKSGQEKSSESTSASRSSFEQGGSESSNDFDRQINQTLSAQENIAPSRSSEVAERAIRIEHFYSNINHAYEKPASHQFLITA